MQTWTSNRKPDGKALVRWLLDVRGSLEMPRILDLNVSHVAIHLQTKYWWNQWFTWNTLIFAFSIQQSQTGRIVSRHTCLWLLTKDLGCVLVTVLLFIYLFICSFIMDKSLGTLAFRGRFSIHTGPTAPLTPQRCCTRLSRIFSEFQLCIGWGEGELQENLEKDALF